jgi:hypothetical protein
MTEPLGELFDPAILGAHFDLGRDLGLRVSTTRSRLLPFVSPAMMPPRCPVVAAGAIMPESPLPPQTWSFVLIPTVSDCS